MSADILKHRTGYIIERIYRNDPYNEQRELPGRIGYRESDSIFAQTISIALK